MERWKKVDFQLAKMQKKEHPRKRKDQVRNWHFIKSRFPECYSLIFIVGGKILKVITFS